MRTHNRCVSPQGWGRSGISRIPDGCGADGTASYMRALCRVRQRMFVQQQRPTGCVRSEFNCLIYGRQSRYQHGNACTEYEDESDV